MLVRVPLMPCMQKTSRSGLSSISQLWDFKCVCLFNIKIKNVPLFTVSVFHVPLLIRLTVPPAEICVEKAKVTGETFHTGSGRTPSSIKQRICFTLSAVTFFFTYFFFNTLFLQLKKIFLFAIATNKLRSSLNLSLSALRYHRNSLA